MHALAGDQYDDLGLPTRWDLRKAMGVCAALNCSRSALGLIPTEGGPLAHDCACCLEHCERTRQRFGRELVLELRAARLAGNAASIAIRRRLKDLASLPESTKPTRPSEAL